MSVIVAFEPFRHQLDGSALRAATPLSPDGLFEFRSELWYNLNHFLYQIARSRKGIADAAFPAVIGARADTAGLSTLSAPERAAWDHAVAYYEKDRADRAIDFDSALVETNYALSKIGAGPLHVATGLDPELVAALNEAAPVYARLWWPRHDAANRAFIARIDSLVRTDGDSIARQLTRIYRVPWPRLRTPVEVVAYANWAGAYMTRFPPLVTISSLYRGHAGTRGLEQLFHEESHGMMDSVDVGARAAGADPESALVRDAEHAIIFFTAGEVVRSIEPAHVPYAEWRGFWPATSGPFARFYPGLDTIWRPYIHGKGELVPTVTRFILTRP